MERLEELRIYLEEFGNVPTIERMPKRTLADKGIYGPTGAHVIEEIHTPFNLSYITVTTGTTAFQNIVGVTAEEMTGRIEASRKALELSGVKPGDRVLLTYPPLVNVFPFQALKDYGVEWFFLTASSRDALIYAMCKEQPDAVIGESSFLRASIEDAKKMGLSDLLPTGVSFLAAGTPLDMELIDVAAAAMAAQVHDLYGCQEFGWLTLDGIPLRPDLSLIPTASEQVYDLIVGGLPTGDRFFVTEEGHRCNPEGKIITYSRMRTEPEMETVICQSPANHQDTIDRLAKTVLRIKGKIVRVSPQLQLQQAHTRVCVHYYGQSPDCGTVIQGPEKTRLLDALLQSQQTYQDKSKTDPTWIKRR